MEKCENVIAKIREILEQETEVKFESETGELFDIHPGMEVSKGKIIEVSNKKSLYSLLFGKERVSAKDYKEMLTVFEAVKIFILDNTSYQQRKKLESME
jgi:hypothetical protein